MELLAKVAIVVVVLIAIAGIGFSVYSLSGSANTLTAQQAQDIVRSDLVLRTPSVNVTTINVTPSKQKGSWDITLKVVYNESRPCPTLFIEDFDYPAYGLVPSTENLYTNNCTIYGLSMAPSYIISAPEIAVVRSYSSGFKPITDYVKAYGYNNTNVHAKFFGTLEGNMTPLNRTFNNVWLINYTAKGSVYSQFAVLSASGSIIGNYTVTRV